MRNFLKVGLFKIVMFAMFACIGLISPITVKAETPTPVPPPPVAEISMIVIGDEVQISLSNVAVWQLYLDGQFDQWGEGSSLVVNKNDFEIGLEVVTNQETVSERKLYKTKEELFPIPTQTPVPTESVTPTPIPTGTPVAPWHKVEITGATAVVSGTSGIQIHFYQFDANMAATFSNCFVTDVACSISVRPGDKRLEFWVDPENVYGMKTQYGYEVVNDVIKTPLPNTEELLFLPLISR